jgi:S1-C subfamily serine protease
MGSRKGHRPCLRAVLLAGAVALLSAHGALAAGDPARGRQLAATWCSACHQIGPAFPEHGPGPPFGKLASDLKYSARYIKDWVIYPHATMPNFRLSEPVLDDLVAYIHSLRETATATCVSCNPDLPDRLFASGSGFFIDRDGSVMTVAHNVRSCSRVTVELPGVFKGDASIVGDDQYLDLALLKTAHRPASFAGIRHGSSLGLGEQVTVFSYPLRGTLSSEGNLSLGYVSALRGIGDNAQEFQMSANLQLGSSGGPVFDRQGRVVGIARSRLVATSAAELPPQGVNFAIGLSTMHLFLAAIGRPHSENIDVSEPTLDAAATLVKSYTVKVACWR